ncbi:hypothetical protein NC651_034247 [Populus alba x Populus x berolinensis]|nr:hypothetical protein NC651_034247 [Populus alba x Populus x berolinensis]
MAASQAALLSHTEKPASSDASHVNPFIQLDKLPSNMVQAKDSELYKPVLMESYTSPGASYPALVFWFELLVVALKFKSSTTNHFLVHFLCFEVAILITHESKGKCELQIQTFREFSARTSYSKK